MDNRRLLLLIIFSFSMVMLWDAWQKYSQPKAILPAPVATTAVPPAPQPSANLHEPRPAAPGTAVATTVETAERVTVRTDLFVAEISKQGGDIVRLEFNAYKDSGNKAKDFALFEAKHQYVAQSGLIGESLPNHRTVFSTDGGNKELTGDAKTVELRLEAPANNGIKVAKIYTFTRGSYLINIAHEIENSSDKEVAAHAYYQLQRDTKAPDGESSMVSTFTGPAVYTDQEKFQKVAFEDIEKGKAKFANKSDNGWIAMVQHYFVAAWIPDPGLAREFYMRKLESSANPAVSAGVIVPAPLAAPGSRVAFSVPLYAGPQIQVILDQLAKPKSEGGIGAQGLPLVVDYGWLTIIAAPIFWCLEAIYKVVGNWGWAIVLLTVGIKLLFFPLSAASYKSMAKMRTVTPRLVAMKERYGDDRQKLNQEMMALYKREKINPLGGCLPIAVQIPVFIALYWALLGAVEIRDAPWILWITDLSAADPYYVMPVIMVVTMLIQTKLNPTPPDPIQAKVMMMMPFIFGAMFFFFPAGLVLYWIVNNILSIAQQWQITRMIESGGKAANDSTA
ncbi:MAG: membrane protein insertase YidC [Candidatus Accumulibacter sp.]|jgi:YidC/Oxa1 family membrane protein insertase|uniref:membrane protein insertase YidC n=2 Tax=Betaproteobacteria incertae sedis TaxID=119066 RepID=UPI001ACE1B56|nr:membrane protein insertase YidC [Accumulibacter sp.]MBK8579495.1 membrane protein insertase YidC [Candidatus Accumulibacter propinquus]MBP6421743.1 membrane protein insertase YidC [Propionivibrio sp.]MBK8115115.1 membrane protein insertase YidC [Accumulibacter sp.]MBK8385567.1 membrane protein insertase YidC [Accumulibacter sp.]MBN8439776.1 membrane protein insertase YidC [Accumulibacter sp.]